MEKGTVTEMNCCRCGKNFDYEKHNGICPKCAAYNRPQGEKPYDYNVDKDFSAHYETMDDSHAKLHRMYDSASAHQPQKQHAEYHRQYDNNYKHPQHAQGQNSVPNYRANQPQGQGGVPNYRANQPQGQNGVPNNGAYQMQGQGGMPQNGTYRMPGQSEENAPTGKSTKDIVVKIIVIILIINIVTSLLYTFINAFY
ncbi:MAG: hypothetical protein HDR15_13845 [Lachnospiraceae bacterium]|nr:hypothetical protein [Lachnospiraceae bacterium]